jgi:mannosylglycerate hydrolase
VGWLSRDDLWVRRIAAGPLVPTPGAQCERDYTYEYAILPHAGDWRNVYATAYNYNAPLLARRADTHPGLELREMNITRDDPNRVKKIDWPRGGSLPNPFSFVQVDIPEFILSAVYRSGNNLIVRGYNVLRQPTRATITFGMPITEAYRANMAEEIQAALPIWENARVVVEAWGGEVVTLKARV